jgi:Ala-tRNA(Pro) deacylase
MKLQDYLKEQGAWFEPHEHPPAYTSQEMAAEEHVTGNAVAKPVTVKAGDKYVMCVLPASYKLDMDKVAKALKAKKVQLADEDEMSKLYPDAEVGAEPPFGNLYDLPTLLDERLTGAEEIVCQAGSHREAVRMKLADYQKLVQPQVADLAVHM